MLVNLKFTAFIILITYNVEVTSQTYNSRVPWQQANSFKDFIPVYEGKNLEFGFPTENDRIRALANGQYNPDSPIPIDIDVYYNKINNEQKIFLTIPRFGSGIPYSLAYLTDVMKPNGSEIQPYPNYKWHSSHGSDCDGLTSVYRTHIDSCGQMWVLDSGEIEFVHFCPPQMIVFDLATNQMIHRYRLPENMYKTNISRFVTPYVDIEDPMPNGQCTKAFVYMADPTGVGIVVYDVVNQKSWRIENKYTYPDPDFGTHTIAGESFELLDGAFTFAVTPRTLKMRRMLYFHSLSNDAQIGIPLDVVNNPAKWGSGISSSLEEFVPLGRRGVQCAAAAMTPQGIFLCVHLNPIALFGWNIRTPYTPRNRVMLAENPETLQFVSGLKVIKNSRNEYDIWMLSNRLQKAFKGTINYNEINFRILKCALNDILLGKSCI